MILAPTLSLLSSGSSAIVRPTFSRDFAGEKSLNSGTGPAITFTRGSIGTYFDASGVLQTASNDVPRFDHSGGSSLGLLIEEARTNSIRNSQAGGVSTGTPGTSPTHWAITGSANGITRQIVGTGTESGLAYIDIKYSGTPTNSDTLRIAAEPSNQIAALNGQTWTSSFYVKLEDGALTNVSVRNGIAGFDSTPTFISGQTASTTIVPTSAGLALQRSSATFAFTSASIAFVRNELLIDYTSGQAIDITLRIAAPQLEQGAFPTSYIPTTTAAVTRSADSAVVTPISSFYNQSEGTLFAEAIAGTASGTASGIHQQTVVQLLENNVGDILAAIYRPNGTTNGSFFVGTAGGTQANLAQAGFTAGANARLAAAYKTDDFALSVNGTAAATDTLGSLLTATTLRIGRYGTASGYLNGHIRRIAYYPKRLSNALLQSLTT